MSVTIINCEQRTPEWFAARAGRLTASTVDAIFATGKGGKEAVGRRDLRIRLALERITGQPIEDGGFINKEMQRGIDLESAARDAYEGFSGNMVRTTGFVAHDSLPVGASLDGDVDTFTGLVEIKCPKSATHLGYLRDRSLPAEYGAQVMHQLWLTGAQWLDFVSYDDRMPEPLRLFVYRKVPTVAEINAHEAAVVAFLAEVDAEVGAITALAEAA